MKKFLNFISESTITVYRGYNPKQKASNVIWVSTSKEHAQMYTDGVGEVKEFKITKELIPLDLQFTSAEVDVNYSDIKDRLAEAIIERFEKNKLTDTVALQLIDNLRELKFSGMMKVYEWMYKPQIITIIKKAGFNVIMQREGLKSYKGNVITYGILDKTMLR